MQAVAVPSDPFPRLRWASLAAVVGAHLACLAALAVWSSRVEEPEPAPVLSVSFLTSAPEPVTPPEPLPPAPSPPKPVIQPKPKPLVTAAPKPEPSPDAFEVPPPPAEPDTSPAEPIAAYSPAAEADPGPAEPEPPRFDMAYLDNPAPAYPPMSHKLGEEGTVLLRVLVSASGAAKTVEIERSSGYGRLDDAAQRAVRKWRFVPAKRGTEAVEGWALVPINFSRKR
jgi:protein TonB